MKLKWLFSGWHVLHSSNHKMQFVFICLCYEKHLICTVMLSLLIEVHFVFLASLMYSHTTNHYRRLHLPVNACAKNMFSTDVKRLCFRCQTLKFPRPNLSLRDLKRLCFWYQTLKFRHISVISYFQDYDDSEPREHWLCRENFAFGRKKFKVWHLKYRRLRSRKLKFGRENFKVWHLKHTRLTSVENMFLARAFTGRCNRRYL